MQLLNRTSRIALYAGLGLCSAGALDAFAQPPAAGPVDIGTRIEMFVDEQLVDPAHTRYVALKLHPPTRREIVLTADQPWEGPGSAYYTVIQDGPRVRLYYRGHIPDGGDASADQVTCYAESADGVTFTRPQLNLYEFQGSKQNNIVYRGVEAHNFAPMLDANPDAEPNARYKAVGGFGGRLFAFSSPDGIHWSRMQSEPIAIRGEFDSLNVVFWDAHAKLYRLYSRRWTEPGYRGYRGVQSSTSTDFLHWSDPTPNRYAARGDGEPPLEHFYTNATTTCPGAPHHYLSFPMRFVPDRKVASPLPDAGVSDAAFLSSRDGQQWDRSFLEAWLRPGRDPRNWTHRNNMPANGIVQTRPDEFSLYASEHYAWPDNRLRRLSVRRHGFASMHANAERGEFTTRPLTFTGAFLRLNFATSATGSVRVELQDEQGRPLPGRTLAESTEMFGDELDAVVTWRDGGDLSAWAGQPVRLRIVLQDADVFALQTTAHDRNEGPPAAPGATSPTEANVPTTEANVPVELVFTAATPHADPFNTVTLDAVFTDPAGASRRVPAFWAGGDVWKVRYASPLVGGHAYRTECSADDDAGLHGVAGVVEVRPYTGDNPLFTHGPVQVAADRRTFEHADGTPFFWLGDTWWMGLCHRLHWPDEVQTLAADRRQKGFNVIQIVAGLYPDMPPLDPRGANEAGLPWEPEFARIRPEYFDASDRRLRLLVDQGFTPCIVGAWGYFIPLMGVEKAERHWRYLIARYAALPVVWTAAGEANLPYYLAKGFPYDDRGQVADWTRVLRYIRATDPYRRPLTIHPTGIGRLSSRHATDDATLLDFDMLQTPHGQRDAVEPTVRTVRESYADTPVMPVINGEAAYEMLGDALPTRWTRQMFWLSMMHGAAGHTYGANGIWQCNRPGEPHGPSPHHPPGDGYGKIPWNEAMQLPGSTQVALGKRLFERFPWRRFTPQPEWAQYDANAEGEDRYGPYAAGIPGEVRIVYAPQPLPVRVMHLEPGASYRAEAFDPVTGAVTELGAVPASADGDWTAAPPATLSPDGDWVLVLYRQP